MQTNKKVIGIDIGGTKIHMGEVQDGKINKETKFSTSAGAPKQQILEEIVAGVAALMTQETAGIGIGVPGLVDEKLGIVHNVQNIPSWNKVALKAELETYFKKPVYITNDGNTFSAGENLYGKGRLYNNFVGITLGTGFGTGIIIDNKIYSGNYSSAGEFGGMPYLEETLEDYCSGKFFLQKFKIPGEKLMSLAEGGDAQALEIFEQFGNHLGNAIKIILFTLSPQAVILGGSVSKGYSYFEKAMRKSVQTFPYKIIKDSLIIECSEIANISILGAAAHFQMRNTMHIENNTKIKTTL